MAHPVPMSPEVRLTRLENGLTVYVMKHTHPPQRADLRLIVKAGSVLEDDDQRGVAHFVEHMAFNGTRHFPKEDSFRFLQAMGMTPGVHFNASTLFEHTDYKLSVPTNSATAIAEGLSFLRDVAHEVTFDAKVLDDERGVVLEEWRLHRDADARMNDGDWATLMQGSRYANRLPIGLPDVIRHVSRETMLRYYNDWYRPDQMAVIAVGDFDPLLVEQQIKSQFDDLPKTTRPRPLSLPTVSRNKPLVIDIERDPEATASRLVVRDLIPKRAKLTKRDYRNHQIERLYMNMLQWRLAEGRNGDDYLSNARVDAYPLTHDTSALAVTGVVAEGHADNALATVVGELASAARYGFRQNELDRAQQTLSARWEHFAGQNTVRTSHSCASELTRNFLDGETIEAPGVEEAWFHELLPRITLDDVDALARQHGSGSGRVVSLKMPSTAFVQSEAALRATIERTTQKPPPLPIYEEVSAPLLAQAPPAGAVVETTTDPKLGVTRWRLANGVRVVFKPSPVTGNNVRVDGLVPGGWSLVSDADFDQARFAGAILGTVGVASFDERQLRLLMAGKEVKLTLRLNELNAGLALSASPEDLETGLQLLYLKLTAPGHASAAFAEWKKSARGWLRHLRDSPQQVFAETVTATALGDHARFAPLVPDMLDRIDLERVRHVWLDRSSNFNGATFVIVGNFEPERLKPLVETYLGSLPGESAPDVWQDIKVNFPTGKVERTINLGTEARSRLYLEFSAPDRWSLDAERDVDALQRLLHRRFDEVLRERMASIYFVSVEAGFTREPTQRHYLRIWFNCAPENVARLRTAVFAELADLSANLVDHEHLDALAKQLRREHEENLLKDDWWARTLQRSAYFGDDFNQVNDIDATIARLTAPNVRAAAQRLFDPQNYVLVIQNPSYLTK